MIEIVIPNSEQFLTIPEFNNVIMKWIHNKHPEIDSETKLYEFCMINHKRYIDVKHLME